MCDQTLTVVCGINVKACMHFWTQPYIRLKKIEGICPGNMANWKAVPFSRI